eukprot:scaffold114218_cov16-Tisochrysis_lutea.AAC.1
MSSIFMVFGAFGTHSAVASDVEKKELPVLGEFYSRVCIAPMLNHCAMWHHTPNARKIAF